MPHESHPISDFFELFITSPCAQQMMISVLAGVLALWAGDEPFADEEQERRHQP